MPCYSQSIDSILLSLHKKPRLIGGIGSKNTFINGFNSPIYTARAGLDFDHRIGMGIGISWLQLSRYDARRDNTPFYLDKVIVNSAAASIVHPELQFSYVNLFVEYTYFKTGKWQFSVPVQFGVGDSRYKYSFNGENITEDKHTILLYEPAVSGEYKITKWFGVGLDVGYRIMIISNKNIGSRFDSPVYSVGAVIFWGELYNMVFRK